MNRKLNRALPDQASEALRHRLRERLATLSAHELAVVLEFTEQIVVNFDPDAVSEFLSWREDPRIESILQIASSLDEAGRDQLLFDAESRIMATGT